MKFSCGIIAVMAFFVLFLLPCVSGQGIGRRLTEADVINMCMDEAQMTCQAFGEMPATWNNITKGKSCSELVPGCTSCQDIGKENCRPVPAYGPFDMLVYGLLAILILLISASAYVWIKRKKRPVLMLSLAIVILVILIFTILSLTGIG